MYKYDFFLIQGICCTQQVVVWFTDSFNNYQLKIAENKIVYKANVN